MQYIVLKFSKYLYYSLFSLYFELFTNITMTYKGLISKKLTEQGCPVKYKLPIGEGKVDMNSLLGHEI